MKNFKETLLEQLLAKIIGDSNDSDESISSSLMNKKVVVRSYGAGVFYCTLHKVKEDSAILNDSRRIWGWDGATELSDLAKNGLKKSEKNRISVAVDGRLVLQIIEILPCSEKCIKSIESMKNWSEHEE